MSKEDVQFAISRSAEDFCAKRCGESRDRRCRLSEAMDWIGRKNLTPVPLVRPASSRNVIPAMESRTHYFHAVKTVGSILRWLPCQTPRRDSDFGSGTPWFVAGEYWNDTATVGEGRWWWWTPSEGVPEQVDRIGDVDESISVDLCRFLTR